MTIDQAIREALGAVLDERLDALVERLNGDPAPLTYTPDQAAAALQVSVSTIHRWVDQGRLPRLPHYSRVLIARRAVEAFANGDSLR